MNFSSILKITTLMLLPFQLNANSEQVNSVLGQAILLSAPNFNKSFDEIKWKKDESFLIRIKSNGEKKVSDTIRHNIFPNGTLIIHRLENRDAGTYEVEAFHEDGRRILQHIITLNVEEPLPYPQLIEYCSNKTLLCVVMYNETSFMLLRNGKKETNQERPAFFNGTSKMTYRPKVYSGKFKCVVKSKGNQQQHVEKEISCTGPAPEVDMFLILSIGGGTVVLLIGVALLVYCIRKRQAERLEAEAEERELRARIVVNDGLKNRKLPQPPVRGASNQPQHHQKLPPPHSEVPQQAGPPQPRPRPHQKPPRRMKERQ